MIGWLILSAVAVIGLAAWEMLVCEGAHLGSRFVVWLYDLAAGRYEAIKAFDPDWERRTLGEPLRAAVGSLPGTRILDVGAGTGRLAQALVDAGGFAGSLVCLEPSRRMLSRGRRQLEGRGVAWLRGWAVPLPFAAGSFDFVVSLEILEFTPRPPETLAELVRVLRPGGWLLITNRVGREARWILGRTTPARQFPAFLQRAGLESIDVIPWQVEYDLAWARKSWGKS